MANEATVSVSLTITKDNLQYRSLPASFRADVTGTKGPTPGALTIPTGGKVLPMGELTTPGFCRIVNHDQTNYIEVGIWDFDRDLFHPLIEVGPGETYIIKLSRNLLEEYVGTGTGTNGPSDFLFAKANTAACNVSVEAFER